MDKTELDVLMRLPHIMRWQIVPVYKNQSVAEHSYRVWLLATSLYDSVFVVPHNSFERDLMQRWAMLHDADEVLTGDIPSTVKVLMEEVSPGVMEKFSDRVLRSLPTVSNVRKGIRGTFAESFVKVADNVEAMLYLVENGMGNCAEIYNSRVSALLKIVETGEYAHKLVEWQLVKDWVTEHTGERLWE